MKEFYSELRIQLEKANVSKTFIEEVMQENLEDRERQIVKEHFGLIPQTEVSGQRKTKSLRQIAEVLGVSKERVRKIELFALQKLRKVLSQEQFELLIQV